jgi:hypothetical protein
VWLCFLVYPTFLHSVLLFILRLLPLGPMRCECRSTRLVWRRRTLLEISLGERRGERGERQTRVGTSGDPGQRFLVLSCLNLLAALSHRRGKRKPAVMKSMTLQRSVSLPFPARHVVCERRRDLYRGALSLRCRKRDCRDSGATSVSRLLPSIQRRAPPLPGGLALHSLPFPFPSLRV